MSTRTQIKVHGLMVNLQDGLLLNGDYVCGAFHTTKKVYVLCEGYHSKEVELPADNKDYKFLQTVGHLSIYYWDFELNAEVPIELRAMPKSDAHQIKWFSIEKDGLPEVDENRLSTTLGQPSKKLLLAATIKGYLYESIGHYYFGKNIWRHNHGTWTPTHYAYLTSPKI